MLPKQSINHARSDSRRPKKTQWEEDQYPPEENDLSKGWKKTQPKNTYTFRSADSLHFQPGVGTFSLIAGRKLVKSLPYRFRASRGRKL
jgi:hypothetical protein